jgi:hypothetical protein
LQYCSRDTGNAPLDALDLLLIRQRLQAPLQHLVRELRIVCVIIRVMVVVVTHTILSLHSHAVRPRSQSSSACDLELTCQLCGCIVGLSCGLAVSQRARLLCIRKICRQ